MAMFDKVKEHPILNIQSEFLNGSDNEYWIRNGVILDLRKEITISRISTEDGPNRAES